MDKKNIIIIICICTIVALSTYIITINTIPQPNNNITNNTPNNTTNITINKTTEQTPTTKNVQKQDKTTYTEEEDFNKLDSNGRYIRGQYQGSTPAEAQEYERREGNRM